MSNHISAIIAGLTVSLSGSLPLGNLNLTALKLSAQKGWKDAAQFSLGAVTVELLYLLITMPVANWLASQKSLFQGLQWLVVLVLLLLAVSSLKAGAHASVPRARVLRGFKLPWVSGLAMSAINPLQFPFWAGWIIVLRTKGILGADAGVSFTFILAAAFGTLLAFSLFIASGSWLMLWMRRHQQALNIAFGMLFVSLAFFQVFTILTSTS